MRTRPLLALMTWAAAATPRCRASEAAQAFAERIHWDYAGRTTQLQEFGKMGTDGVIVLQEWWGVTGEIRAQASRISRQGYHVVVPDLYHVRAPRIPSPLSTGTPSQAVCAYPGEGGGGSGGGGAPDGLARLGRGAGRHPCRGDVPAGPRGGEGRRSRLLHGGYLMYLLLLYLMPHA
eukprot:COSAG04_NODE_69_length_29236_cov_15.813680_10_plen_177_part_00